MKLLKLLGLNLEDKPKVFFGSYAGSGKTTLLSILAAEVYLDGKKVLYLTETKSKPILKRIEKYLGKKVDVNGAITIDSVVLPETNLKPFFQKGFDLVIIDFPTRNYQDLVHLSQDYNTPIFVSTQLSTFSPKNDIIETNRTQLHAADMFVAIKRKNHEKKWYDFLLFWKKKPNTTLKVVKNRFGKEFTTDLHVDFENVKIK